MGQTARPENWFQLSYPAYSAYPLTPGNYHLDRSNDVYVPIGQWGDPTFRDRKVSMGSNCVARMKDGVSIARAQGDLDAVAANLAATYPEADKGVGIGAYPLKSACASGDSACAPARYPKSVPLGRRGGVTESLRCRLTSE